MKPIGSIIGGNSMENIRSSKDVPPIPNKEEQKQVPKIKLVRPESQCDNKRLVLMLRNDNFSLGNVSKILVLLFCEFLLKI